MRDLVRKQIKPWKDWTQKEQNSRPAPINSAEYCTKNDYNFSPNVKHWLGRECNVVNVKQTAKRRAITDPLSFTRQELWTMY